MLKFKLVQPILLTIAALSSAVPLLGQETKKSNTTAEQAGTIMRRYCYRCHRGSGSESGYAFNASDAKSMLDESMVFEGDHENSSIYEAMYKGKMPPKNRPQLPRPSAEEIGIIKEWITNGAVIFPEPTPRVQVSLKNELTMIRDHLQNADRDDRPNFRYFSLLHLQNDVTVDEELLKMTRLGLSKALNSLSWEPFLAKVTPLDSEKTLYAVDISKLGWTREHWNALVQEYPYALSYGSLDDSEIADLDDDISDLRRDQTPSVLRADWMIAVGTKPPLYYDILFDLHLPQLRSRRPTGNDPANPKSMTDLDLEYHLGVNVIQNLLDGSAKRSAFTESGVSGQNRLIERHSLRSGGFYWKSYDFKSSNRTAILTEFPLGPRFEGNHFDDLAFVHDGGEMIFNLPNGLQGYLLTDGQGNRIDAGPIEVVSDSLKTSGNEQIVAGISCIACHRNGMIESPNDEVRPFSGVVNDARRQVRELYPPDNEMQDLVIRDSKQFAQAMTELSTGILKDETFDELPEPIGEVARRYYLEPLTLKTVAAELSIDVDKARAAIEADPVLRRLGLRVLLREGGTIKRAAWESPAAFPLMKQVARQFNYDAR